MLTASREEIVTDYRCTRREALKLGALGIATVVVTADPVLAATVGPDVFELDVSDALFAGPNGFKITTELRAPHRFDLIGVRFTGASDPKVQARVHRDGLRWTDWFDLPVTSMLGPDGTQDTLATEPAWTGPADEFQLRIKGDVRSVYARFVYSTPAAATASVTRDVIPPVTPVPEPTGGQPAPELPPKKIDELVELQPKINSRATWSAAFAPPRASPTYGKVDIAIVHHTETPNGYTPDQARAAVLSIARYHIGSHHWNDIGYNFLVDKYGCIFEGRAGGVERAVIGAHTSGFNVCSVGIACLGSFTEVAQTEEGMNALARLIAWKFSLHGVPALGNATVVSTGGRGNRYKAGKAISVPRISAHRDFNHTDCPGNMLYRQLPDLRERVARLTMTTATVTIATSGSKFIAGVPMTLSGTITGVPRSLLVNPQIQIQAARGNDWVNLATVGCANSGSWKTRITLQHDTTLRAALIRPTFLGPPTSTALAVRVDPQLRVTKRGSSRVHSRLTISGSCRPCPASGRISYSAELKIGKRWVVRKRGSAAVTNNRFRFFVQPHRCGHWRVVVKVPRAQANTNFTMQPAHTARKRVSHRTSVRRTRRSLRSRVTTRK